MFFIFYQIKTKTIERRRKKINKNKNGVHVKSKSKWHCEIRSASQAHTLFVHFILLNCSYINFVFVFLLLRHTIAVINIFYRTWTICITSKLHPYTILTHNFPNISEEFSHYIKYNMIWMVRYVIGLFLRTTFHWSLEI